MEQYIKKSVIMAEIEKRIKELQDLFKEDDKKLDSFQKAAIYLCIDECKVVLSIIDTLEVKEVEHSADAFIEKAVSYLEGTLFNEVCYGEIRPDIVQAYINDFKKAMRV